MCSSGLRRHELPLDSKMSLKRELKAEKAEVQKATEEIQKLKKSVADTAAGLAEKEKLGTEVKDLKEERDRLLGEKARMEEEMAKKLEEASEYYKNQLIGLIGTTFKEGEVKGVKETYRHSFLLGYQVGLDYAEVPKDGHLREPAVVPEVELSSRMLPSEQLDPGANTDEDAA